MSLSQQFSPATLIPSAKSLPRGKPNPNSKKFSRYNAFPKLATCKLYLWSCENMTKVRSSDSSKRISLANRISDLSVRSCAGLNCCSHRMLRGNKKESKTPTNNNSINGRSCSFDCQSTGSTFRTISLTPTTLTLLPFFIRRSLTAFQNSP